MGPGPRSARGSCRRGTARLWSRLSGKASMNAAARIVLAGRAVLQSGGDKKCTAQAHLLDSVPERSRVLAHTDVTGKDGHQLRRLAENLGSRQVDGIERSNGLDRKWTAGSREHGVGDGDDVASPFERLQGPHRGPRLIGGNTTGRPGAHKRAGGFRERECRCHRSSLSSECRPSCRVAFKQGGENRAGLDVTESEDGCLNGAEAPAARGARRASGGSSATLRHGRCRSVQ